MRYEYGSTARGTALTQIWRWGPGRVVAGLGYNSSGRLTSASAWAGGPHETIHFDPDDSDDRINRIYNTATGDMVFLSYSGNSWIRSERGSNPAGFYGTTTHYGYNDAGKLSIAWVDMQGAGSNPATRFTHQQALGLRQGQPVARGDVYSSIDGPRNDAADIVRMTLDAWGGAAVVLDPFNDTTLVTRAHTHFPGLVTRTVGQGGLVHRNWFDALGRLDSARVENPLNDGRHAVTRVLSYDSKLHHFPTRTMGPDGVVTEVAYDTMGNVLWSQAGPDPARRVRFEYVQAGRSIGQLSAVHSPLPGGQVATTTYAYDTVGNRRLTRDPRGLLSLEITDSWGRVKGTVTPLDSAFATTEDNLLRSGVHTAITYGARGQDSITFTYGPLRRVPWVFGTNVVRDTVREEGVAVEKLYDAAGNLTEVTRWSTTDPSSDRPNIGEPGLIRSTYKHDLLGRVVERKEGDDNTTLFKYDLAGNVVETTTGVGHTLRATYDALGRLVQSRTPSVSYARLCAPHVPEEPAFSHDYCDDPRNHFPFFPNDVNKSYVVAEDVSTYWYDMAGRLVAADNSNARVRRSYFRSGLLATDSVQIRDVTGNTFGTTYGVAYGYDIAGRPLWVGHPSNLASGQLRDQVTYDPDFGSVTQLVSRAGVTFNFGYDAVGRLTSRTSPAGREVMEYDHMSQLVRRTTPVFNEGIRRDARGKSVEIQDGERRFHNHFSALGSLVGVEWQRGITGRIETEEFRTNTVGQTLWRRSRGTNPSHPSYHPEDDLKHEGISGRLLYSAARKPADYGFEGPDPRLESQRLFYDKSGNMTWSRYLRLGMDGPKRVDRAYYHGADNRLMAVQTLEDYHMFFTGERRGSFEEFRYDALGRRVLKRTRRGQPICRSNSTTVDCSNVVERFVWSGNNLLWETRSDDDNPAAGHVGGEHLGAVGYTHGGGTDQPLVVWKGGDVVIPHATWRGSFGMGTNVSGAAASRIQWPAYTSTAWHKQTVPPNRFWFGSLVGGSRDVSGLMYMRARYYDPQSGQFTQQDPIGVAGGLNTYGFGNGDPVSNRDPSGLSAEPAGGEPCIDASNTRCDVVYRMADVTVVARRKPRPYWGAGPSVVERNRSSFGQNLVGGTAWGAAAYLNGPVDPKQRDACVFQGAKMGAELYGAGAIFRFARIGVAAVGAKETLLTAVRYHRFPSARYERLVQPFEPGRVEMVMTAEGIASTGNDMSKACGPLVTPGLLDRSQTYTSSSR
jgi:RHS repeat-associated protein